MDVMYELPSLDHVTTCIVDQDSIEGLGSPQLVTNTGERFRLPDGPAIQKSA